jgi:3-deoxy-D-manno-octulosonate 8-phosphate phosphatase (KDO 8-P phosphatase)
MHRPKPLDLREVAKQFEEKLSKIKVCLFDVDGILTSGQLYWSGQEVGFNRFFDAQDGFGLKTLQRAGLKVGIITGGDSLGVIKRFQENLKLDFVYYGNENKLPAYEEILEKTGASPEEVLYMGDEFFDLPILKRVGFSATAPHASIEIRESVDYVTHREGGHACAREVIDLVRHVQGIIPKVEGL